MPRGDKPLVWLHGEVKSPPFSHEARIEAGSLLRALQSGRNLGLPHPRPMPAIAARCHELRIVDRDVTWRVIYRIDTDAIPIVDIFAKKTQRTPIAILRRARARLSAYNRAAANDSNA